MATIPTPRFLDFPIAQNIAESFGTPVYVYDRTTLEAHAKDVLAFPNAYGLTARYAMKAAPNVAILKLFNQMGLWIDASSGYEVHRAFAAGYEPHKISLSTQEFPADFADLYEKGIEINACSINQLRLFAEAFPGCEIGLRFNQAQALGAITVRTWAALRRVSVSGMRIDEVKAIVAAAELKVARIHTHIGSGSDPSVWQKGLLDEPQLGSTIPRRDSLESWWWLQGGSHGE